MDFIKMIARHEGHDHSEMDMSGMDMGSNTTAEAASSMDMDSMGSCKSKSKLHIISTPFQLPQSVHRARSQRGPR
jgi:hypothetical protein